MSKSNLKYKPNLADLRKTTQLRLDTENEGLGFNPKANRRFADGKSIDFPNKQTSMERKNMAEETPSGKRDIVDADAWMNVGGKGFFVKIDGKEYITSIESVKALLSGEKQGVKLGLLKPE